MTGATPKAVVARFWELYNSPDTTLQTADLCADDGEHHQAALFGPASRYVWREPQVERIKMVRAAFSGWHVTPLQTIADGEDVACRYAWMATSRVPLGNFAAGSRLCMDASCFFKVRGGVIVRIYGTPGLVGLQEEEMR